MNIQKISFINCQPKINTKNNSIRYNEPSFKAASDITLHYVLKNHERYLPQRVANEIRKFYESSPNVIPSLKEFHNRVYEGLFNAKTLEEVKELYPEFKEVLDLTTLKDNRSKAVKAIREQMPLEDFTLQYLKDLYYPVTMEKLVEKYNVTNRSILCWLNDKLKIPKLNTNYINLLRMSDEAENQRISELSRKAIYDNPQAQRARLQKAADTHRTFEYRTKKRQEMIAFYQNHPERAHIVSVTGKMTWDACPEIRTAMREFTSEQPDLVKQVLAAKRKGQKLNENQRKITQGFYKRFWEKYAYLKEPYRQARLNAAQLLRDAELIK